MELFIPHKKSYQQKRDWPIFTGFMVAFIICTTLFAVLIKTGVLRWPFRRADGIAETYKNIVFYTPILTSASLSLIWLKLSGFSVIPLLKRRRFSKTAWFGVAVSAGYSVYLYMTFRFGLKGCGYWFPVVILSMMNAVSEELVFRLVCYRLAKKIVPGLVANLFQSALYASIHLPIGGIRIALPAFCYGFLLGIILERDKSLLPCIVSHFLIDIAHIGLPLLIVLPAGS